METMESVSEYPEDILDDEEAEDDVSASQKHF